MSDMLGSCDTNSERRLPVVDVSEHFSAAMSASVGDVSCFARSSYRHCDFTTSIGVLSGSAVDCAPAVSRCTHR